MEEPRQKSGKVCICPPPNFTLICWLVVFFLVFICRHFKDVAQTSTVSLPHPWEPATLHAGDGLVVVTDGNTGSIVANVSVSF
jgi:hypothetical protein